MFQDLATVITNLFSAIPWIGPDLVEFIWGGSSVDEPTLNRFFSLHFLLPFILAALVVMHLIALHKDGSNNPTGSNNLTFDGTLLDVYDLNVKNTLSIGGAFGLKLLVKNHTSMIGMPIRLPSYALLLYYSTSLQTFLLLQA